MNLNRSPNSDTPQAERREKNHPPTEKGSWLVFDCATFVEQRYVQTMWMRMCVCVRAVKVLRKIIYS